MDKDPILPNHQYLIALIKIAGTKSTVPNGNTAYYIKFHYAQSNDHNYFRQDLTNG